VAGGWWLVGPWARGLVGSPSAPDLVARGPLGPWLIGAPPAPDVVTRGPVGPKKISPPAPDLSFSI